MEVLKVLVSGEDTFMEEGSEFWRSLSESERAEILIAYEESFDPQNHIDPETMLKEIDNWIEESETLESLLEFVRDLVSTENEWVSRELSETEKKLIHSGLADLEKGNTISDEEAWKRFEKWG
ncbi:MAG: hypothetical protein H6581_22160 [Bacteroidia bacterium]|nr:hypothetical protein [Bacteroidia bacterium]